MSDTLTHQTEPFEGPDKPVKKGCGCVSFIMAFLVFVVAIIAAVWIVIMHTSVPLRFVADLIQVGGKSSNLKITGLSGSLSSRLSFKKVTWNDGEITDMRFRYSGLMDLIRRDELIIYEMQIGSATIYKDSTADKTEETVTDPATTSSDSSSTSSDASSDSVLKLFQIDRVSLNKIIIEDRATGKTINIPKIEWTGFKAAKGADIQFGDFVAHSDHLAIKSSNPSGSVYLKRFEIDLLPKLHDTILKPIKIDAYIGGNDIQPIYEIKAFDDSVTLTKDKSGTQQIITKDANLADFLDIPLPNKLNIDFSETKSATDESTITINSGSFQLGTKAFEIQPLSFANQTSTNPNLIAIHRAGETEIRYSVLMNQPGFKANLTSTHVMSPEDLLAFIYHEREFSTLSIQDQEKLRKHMTWLAFEK